MVQLTTIDRDTLKMLRVRIDQQLAPLAKELGISLTAGKGGYGGLNGNLNVEIAVVVDGKVQDRRTTEFAQLAPQFGLKPEDLGRIVTVNGTAYKIVGLNAGAEKFPVMVERVSDNKGFKLTLKAVGAKDPWAAENMPALVYVQKPALPMPPQNPAQNDPAVDRLLGKGA